MDNVERLIGRILALDTNGGVTDSCELQFWLPTRIFDEMATPCEHQRPTKSFRNDGNHRQFLRMVRESYDFLCAVAEQTQALTSEASQGLSAFRDNMEALQHNFLLRGYFEKRGYHDTSELKEHSIARLPNRKPAKEFDYDTREIFDKPANAKLKNKKALDEVGKYLEENQFGLSLIVCSDEKGDSDKLRLLTEARAKVVRDYLTQNFKVDDKRVKTIGLGKAKSGEESSKLVVLVYPPAGAAQQHSSASGS